MLHFVKSFTCAACTIYVFCIISHVKAGNIEELQAQYVKYIMECTQQFPITENDLDMLREKQMPDNAAVKCVFACAYKKAGIMDSNGFLSVHKVYALSEKYLAGDENQLRKAKLFAEACQSVNGIDLSRKDNSHCERAALIFQCSLEKAPQFDFIA